MTGSKEENTMTDPIIIRAREIFVERNKPGIVREIAAMLGAYDHGTDIQQYMEEASADVLRDLPENIEE